MALDKLIVRGAREHNLKNIDVEIPRDQLVVITGLSGSGKSSLAFDTIYAEGQRRYVESLSAYARQFLGLMEKPDVDQIEGLSPAISIDQKGSSRNPRSTVGTVTEAYDYLRLLYARIGTPHCPECGRQISQQTVQQIVDSVLELPEGERVTIMAPLIKDRKGEHKRVFEDIQKAGYVRVRVNGEVRDVDEQIELDRYKMHTIEAMVDRLVVRPLEGMDPEEASDYGGRLADSVETALKLGDGLVIVSRLDADGQMHDMLYSEHFSCVHCGISLPEIEPRTFSFNTPYGACPTCGGLGTQLEFDPDLIIPDRSRSIAQGAIQPWQQNDDNGDGYYKQMLKGACKHYGIPINVPVSELSPKQVNRILYGGKAGDKISMHYKNRRGEERLYETSFEGVIGNLQRRYRETQSDYMRSMIERYMTTRECPACGGKRLKPEALAVTIDGHSIHQISELPVARVGVWVRRLQEEGVLTRRQQKIAYQILREIHARLNFMVNVGLDYLTLSRRAATLSGGEAQRIRLATQIGSQLMGVLYILDEPSIGLHQRDNVRLINTLREMRDLGNTILVIEHDEETMRSADWIIDMGPGAGEHGGLIVAAGPLSDIEACPQSITGQFLKGERALLPPAERHTGNGHDLFVRGATENNLKSVDVRFPLGRFIAVTGVSGSGKSSLVIEVLYKKLAQMLYRAKDRPGAHRSLEGLEHIDKVIDINQTPIGRTPRSNPATYADVFTPIRDLFASLPESKARGYKPGRFSFNVKGGRCEACRGDGIIRIEMQFLPDVYVPCEVCHGKRYNREALDIRYKGKTISDVLDMTVAEAMEFFTNIPAIRRRLQTLYDVGLGYIRLGQPATTLSGGEAQRIKLAKELSRRATGRTVYILDEPTTGLHFADVERLLEVLTRLVDTGNTVIVIEHNMDVIKTADWIIDMGPEGGDAGGWVIAEGTPEDIAEVSRSSTGHFLKQALRQHVAAGAA